MDPRPDRLREDLESLRGRVERIERSIGLRPASGPPPAALDEAAGIPATPRVPEARVPAPEAPPQASFPPERFVRRPLRERPDASPSQPPASEAPNEESWRLERLIGGRWYAIAGALIVTIGVALFFKLALDRGWMSFPPAARCLAGAALGFVMLGAGEWLRRRTLGLRPAFQSFAPVGLNAAGVGCMYAAAFAAYGLYQLVGAAGGFLLLAAAAAMGITVGARARQAAVTVVSLAAGYAAPFIVEAMDPHPLVMPAYLVALLTVGETLCAWRAGRFAVVRLVAWLGTVGVGTLWALDQGVEHLAIASSFFGAVWVIIHAELVWTAFARGFPAVNWFKADLKEDWAAIRPYAVSLSTGLWSMVLATILLRRWGGTEEWVPCAIGAAACGALGVVLGRGARVLTGPLNDDASRLGVLLLAQAGAATVGGVALGLAGWTEVVAWLAMGLAALAAGSWIGSRGLHAYGMVVLTVAAGRLTVHDAWAGELTVGGVEILGLVLTRWSLLMAVAGVAWCTAGCALGWGAWRGGQRGGWRIAGEAALTTGVGLATASLFNPQGDAFSMIASLITAGFVLFGLAAALRSTLVATAAFTAYASAAVWIVVNGWFLRWTAGVGVEVLGLHLTRYTALMVYAAFAWLAAARLVQVRALPDLGTPAPTVCAGLGIACLGASIVHQDADLASISAAWGLIALALAAARPIVPGLHLERFAVGGLVAAIGSWIAAYPPYPTPEWTEMHGWFMMSRPFLQGVWLTCATLGVARVFSGVRSSLESRVESAGDDGVDRHRWSDQAEVARDAWRLCVGGAVVVVWVASTSEAARIAAPWSEDATARHAAASIWWGVFGVAMIVAGFGRRISAVRHSGLALLGIATGKALLIDLAAVGMEGRVASFLGLGLLMLGVAVLYARIAARLGGAVAGPREPEGPVAPPRG